jgi:hypothetical protein
MFKIVLTHGRLADREECRGDYSLFLTTSLVEEFYYVGRNLTYADLTSVKRFSVRKPTDHPFRIAGADGSECPVLELRFRFPKFLTMLLRRAIEQKVEFVH